MRSRTSDIFIYIIMGLLVLVLSGAVILGVRRGGRVKCRNMRICVVDSCENHYIDAAKVRSIISREYGGCINRPLDSIKLHRIEAVLNRESSIRKSIAWKTVDGTLHVNVFQRTPVARIICDNGIYYMDEDGITRRTATDWADGITDICGRPPMADGKRMKRLADVVCWFRDKGQWSSRIDRFICSDNGEISLRLTDRKETFVLGRPSRSRIREQSKLIRIYENKIAPSADKEYRNVNLKYNGQIICK